MGKNIGLSSEVEGKLTSAYEKYKQEVEKLLFAEATKMCNYKEGDIIEDHFQIGMVLGNPHFSYSVKNWSYSLSFKCERLTKKLIPFKSGEQCTIFACNIKKHHKRKENSSE